jgi:hypothetical protein
MKPAKVHFVALSLALALLAGASEVMAERIETPGISESSWDFELYIDFWFPAAPATIIVDGDVIPEIPESVRNIYRALNFASMARFRAQKGPLGLFLNNIYYNGTWKTFLDVDGTDIRYNLNEKVFLTDFGAAYEIGRWDIGKNGKSREITLEPFVGARYFIDNITQTYGSRGDEVFPPVTTHTQVETFAPIAGLQSRAQLSNDWDVLFTGLYGGFNMNNMKKTSQLDLYFEYNFNWGKTKDKSAKAYLGYRYLDLEYIKDVVSLEITVKGPVVGVAFLF